MSPGCTLWASNGSSVSSAMRGSPYDVGVAPARTNSHRGVITPTPNDKWLGLTRWTVIANGSLRYACNASITRHRPLKEHFRLRQAAQLTRQARECVFLSARSFNQQLCVTAKSARCWELD